jgi:hypothetical protein
VAEPIPEVDLPPLVKKTAENSRRCLDALRIAASRSTVGPMGRATSLSTEASQSLKPLTAPLRVPQGLLRAPTFVQALSAESWRGLFEKNSETLIDAGTDGILARLGEGVVDDIIDALEFIHAYYADDGLDFVLDLIATAGINVRDWAMEDPAADTLAGLWIRSKSDPRLQQVLVGAQLEAAARDGRRTRYRYVPGDDQKLVWTDDAKSRLREHLSGLFKDGGLTGNVTIDAQQTPGHVSLYVLRGTRRQRLSLMDDASGVTAPSNIRAACCDLIYLDLDDARIEIMPSEQRLTAPYARILGEVLFGRAEALVIEESFNLAALFRGGRSLKVKGRPDVAVRLEVIEWEPAAGDRMTARGRNCLGTLVRELKHLGQQRVLQARFVFHFKKTRHHVGVTLRSSHGIKCTRESDRLEIEELLGHMGLLGSSLAAPFWECAGRPRPACRWRRALGGRFDALLSEGFLLDAPLDAAPPLGVRRGDQLHDGCGPLPSHRLRHPLRFRSDSRCSRSGTWPPPSPLRSPAALLPGAWTPPRFTSSSRNLWATTSTPNACSRWPAARCVHADRPGRPGPRRATDRDELGEPPRAEAWRPRRLPEGLRPR